VFWIVNFQVIRQHQTIQNAASIQQFFTPVFNGVDTGWRFPVNWTVTADFLYSSYQDTHWAFSDAMAIFCVRYLEKTLEKQIFSL
jgi:hypothetical protein